jgi:hypothetical protein
MRDRRADSRLDTILFLFLSSIGTLSELELGCCWIGAIFFASIILGFSLGLLTSMKIEKELSIIRLKKLGIKR